MLNDIELKNAIARELQESNMSKRQEKIFKKQVKLEIQRYKRESKVDDYRSLLKKKAVENFKKDW